MTPRERTATAMNLGRPDRVPVMCQMSIGHMLVATRLAPAEFWLTAEVFAEGLVALRERYGFDGILVSLHGHAPDWERHVARRARSGGEEILHWQNGDRTVFPPDNLPRHYPARTPPRPDLTALDPAALPGKIHYIPVCPGLRFPLHAAAPYRIFDLVRERAGGRFSIHGEVTSPFDYFLDLFGLEAALVHLVEAPARCQAILQRYTDGVERLAVEQLEHGVDAIKISSPYAGAGFISPAFYREFVRPGEGRIARAVRARGRPVYTHTCGAIGDRLEAMVEAGVSGLECLDPPPLGDVRLVEAKARVGGRVFLKGNLDPVNVLLRGTVEDVAREARGALAAGKPGGGYILSTACSIAPRTPPPHVQVLAQVVEEHGRYT